MERREPEVELHGVRRGEGSQDTSAQDMETRRAHVQQVNAPASSLVIVLLLRKKSFGPVL